MFRVDPDSQVPPARQLIEHVLDQLASGGLAAGDKLPSVRAMAAQALVNPNTVGKAYKELEGLGVVRGRNGSGVYAQPEGPEIARALRQDATREALLTALELALRSGQPAHELLAAIETHLDTHCPNWRLEAPERQLS